MRDKDLFDDETGDEEAQKTKTGRFVLTYDSVEDPPPEEMKQAVETLSDHHVVEVMPGTILVEGNETAITEAACKLSAWSMEPERWLKSTPPHKRLLGP